MPKIPGTFDGQRFKDMRLIHLSVPLIMWYAQQGTFESIVKVNSGQVTVSVWLRSGAKHSWRSGGYKQPHQLTLYDANGRKVSQCSVTLPDVPKALCKRYSTPTADEIYMLVRQLERTQSLVQLEKGAI